MRNNFVLLLVVLLYSILIVVFPFQVGDGALLPFITLFVAIALSGISKFSNYKYKQIFFIIVFGYLILVSHLFGITLHTGALFTTNFSYFLKLSLIPIIFEIVIGIFIFLASLKWRTSSRSGLSIILIGYFTLVSFMMFMSLLFHALSNHSV